MKLLTESVEANVVNEKPLHLGTLYQQDSTAIRRWEGQIETFIFVQWRREREEAHKEQEVASSWQAATADGHYNDKDDDDISDLRSTRHTNIITLLQNAEASQQRNSQNGCDMNEYGTLCCMALQITPWCATDTKASPECSD